MEQLTGCAFVTGGGSGISKAICMGFARSGARGLVVADINIESATRTAIESQGVATNPNFRAEAVQINVAEPDSVQNAIDRTVGIFERIDYCVNGAGIIGDFSDNILNTSIEQFKRVMDVNLFGTFLVLRAVSKVMASQEPIAIDPNNLARGTYRGAVVNIGSIYSLMAVPDAISYVTSKHAVLGLTRSAAISSASHDIRVNCICPSHIDTPLIRHMQTECPTEPSVASLIPKGRMGLPEEIVDLVMFLCSPKSNWVNGTSITIDGAMTAGHNFQPINKTTE
ncbi:NAD(P)-binding protein [Hypomontagnella monticulosa]|nr:NAD(P)-binding protein [Hypomontagnella monticulosa]